MKRRMWLVASVLVALVTMAGGCSLAGWQPEGSQALPAAATPAPAGPTLAPATATQPVATATRPAMTATPGTTTGPTATTEQGAQPTAAPPPLARGSTVFFDITVGPIDHTQALASHSTAGRLAVIPLTVTNTSAEARVFVASDVYLLDAQNHRYRAVHVEGWDVRIPPGASKPGILVYDMAGEASPRRLVFTDSSHPDQILLSLDLEP